MAASVLKNAYLSINAVNLSTYVRSLSVPLEVTAVESSTMGDNTVEHLPGLKGWTIDAEFNQDYAASAVDATLSPLVGAAAFAIEVRPDAGAVSATNPKWTGNAIISSYQPIGGSVGDMAIATVTLVAAGDLTRATA